jgi:hypothetical protein
LAALGDLLVQALGLIVGDEIVLDEQVGDAAGVGIGALLLLVATEIDLAAGGQTQINDRPWRFQCPDWTGSWSYWGLLAGHVFRTPENDWNLWYNISTPPCQISTKSINAYPLMPP